MEPHVRALDNPVLAMFFLLQLIMYSAVLCTREEFLKVLNLAGIDVVTVKLCLDRKVSVGKSF